MARGSSNPDLEPTSPIDAIFGAYDIGKYRVPYLSCVLTVQQCADYLALAGDDPAFTLANGKVEELFQRDIDEERVVEMSRNYLNPDAASRPAFFNSITVALLVKQEQAAGAPPKNPSDLNEQTAEFGPIRISWERTAPNNLPQLGSFGCLYWNKLGVHAVAIDGQHRLAALKRLGDSAGPRTKSLGVSIIFLVLDSKFGLRADEKRPVELMRQLFIDLNKHARKVSRSRELLLDDLDPIAVALRQTIGKQLNLEVAGSVDGLPRGGDGEFDERLPLELVDWTGEQRAKVDAGPYATSILAFEWALVALCKSKRFDRKPLLPSMFYDEVVAGADESEDDDRDYYARVRPLLRPWFQTIPELEQALELAATEQVPFALDARMVGKMGSAIHQYWGRAITHLLTRAGPYRRLALLRHSEGTLNAQFGTWYQAKDAYDRAGASAKSALRDRLEAIKAELAAQYGNAKVVAFQKCVDQIESGIKKISVANSDPEPHLLFYLTGQRSMVLALRWLFDYGSEPAASAARVAEALGWPEPTTRGAETLIFAQVLSDAISHWDGVDGGILFTKACACSKSGGLPPTLWRGSIVKRETSTNDIDFSGIAAERGARMLYLLAAIWLYKRTGGPSPEPIVRKWCDSGKVVELKRLDDSAAGRHLRKALVNVAGFEQFEAGAADENKYPFAFLAKMKTADGSSFSYEDLRALTRSRFEWLWKRAGATS
jgi:DGQHR domain-containing protein